MDRELRDAGYWIDRLRLEPHPEGGYYRHAYRAELNIGGEALPPGFADSRPVATAIYFLLDGTNFSAFHRLCSDEMWHFYAGAAVVVHVIEENGKYSEILLGGGEDDEAVFQAVVKAGCWFASEVRDGKSWALVGCTVSPGFDFADFELGKRQELVLRFPQHANLIERLTR
jgi:uncharacterized protein